MTVEIDQIPYADLGPNAIVVIRMPEGHTFGEADKRLVDRLTVALREQAHESTQVLILRHGTEVFTIPEEQMNRAGWFRHNPQS